LKDKVYYTPLEVSKALSIETYVLRYWETQFPFLKPERTKSGWRRYKKEDISKVILIRKLLYDEHFTIEGAKRRLKELQKKEELNLEEPFQDVRKSSIFKEIREDLEKMLEMLS